MKEKILTSKAAGTVEVRGFGDLRKLFDERDWSLPIYFKLDGATSDLEVAKELELPMEKIESVIINGKADPFGKGVIKPGDRVAFVPPGTPGPYRAILGMVEGE
ncbi:MoaD/ThiS family protein [Halanaerobaculum tunisiense]